MPEIVPPSPGGPPGERGFLPAAEACRYLGCSPEELRGLVARKLVSALRLPEGGVGFAVADLDALPKRMPLDHALRELNSLSSQPAVTQSGLAASTDHRAVSALLPDLLAEVRALNAMAPRWLDAADVTKVFGIDPGKLRTWVENGFVRKAKLGETFQSRSLYSAEDLDDILHRISLGQQPMNALRRAGR